ncbi:salicylate 1-hydroxylase-like protein [Hyaloscypha bicolor E]|uniref:Salicylate 1-hydroxylase-like protein n=1 Tax=Hyaloscypha bicolor E TaxID=1095630 RepID=A0A2J6SLX3_9HELO|nr:salicylate 1-hydroxylase-like protein [Hyaloscypha bicolor E]PMD51720.1 salicylate 1-hydroxylase-like protein [Hyaloscypha bicolor E]
MAPSDTREKPFHVAVCGGGIGGLCMLIGLLRQNISCTLYESAAAFAEIGAGVSFGPNAVRAMSLIDPDIKKGYDRIATGNAWPAKKNLWFEFNLGPKEDGWKDLKAPGKEGQRIAQVVALDVGQSSVHRAHFLDVLVDLVPDGVAQFGKRVEKVEKKGQKMLLTFQDGSTAEADAVIGCDGVKSRARQILLGEDHETTNPTFTGKYAYRGLIPMEKAAKALGDELARNSQMYLGRHGHVLTFPIENGKTMNVVAFQTKMDGKWEDERWVLPMKKEDMFADFEGWGESVQKVLSLMEKPDVWALFDHPPAPTYFKGHFALLGDAAHASTPHQGAGAGQAIEDAFILSNLLGQVNSVDEIERAFYAYDAVRRPRSQKVVATSRDAAKIYEFEDEKLKSNLVMIKKTLEMRYDWIWNEDLPQQLKTAEAIMGSGQACR